MKVVIGWAFLSFASIIFYLPLLRKGKPYSWFISFFSAANTLLYPNNYTLFFNLN